MSLEDLETENAALYRRLAERGESSDPQRNPSNDNIIAQGVMELFVPNGSSLSLAEEAGSSKDDILDADLRVQEPLDGSDDSLNPIDLEVCSNLCLHFCFAYNFVASVQDLWY